MTDRVPLPGGLAVDLRVDDCILVRAPTNRDVGSRSVVRYGWRADSPARELDSVPRRRAVGYPVVA